MHKVAFHTLGCKVNQYETEGVSQIFKDNGYEVVDFDDSADIYVINTCTVTNLGDRKSRQMIRKAKTTNSDSIIVVMGCYAQTSPDEVEEIPEVNLIIGTKDRKKIIELIEQYKSSKEKINIVNNIMTTKEFEEIPVSDYKDHTRAFLKIQEGCSQFCSYCIIPYARGPIRSRGLDEVLKELKKLAEHGFKEIVLTGIHIASYGKDLEEDINLLTVITEANKIHGLERIRLGSLEPNLITQHFIDSLKNLDKFCPHFHISLQSGCDETLKRMNRKYTTDQYRNSVKLIREAFYDASITTDMMVGFPGETEDEFRKSFDFAKEINFAKIHVFKYSPRKGTPAAKYSEQVESKIKEDRSAQLIKLSNECERDFYNRYINTTQSVLFEQHTKPNEKYYEGLTKNYIKVVAYSEHHIKGKILDVKLEAVNGDYVTGSIEFKI